MPAAELSERGLPALGVGITYSSAIEPILERHPDLVDVVEVEPQTTWIETRDEREPYRVSTEVLDHIAELPGRKIVHSIGVPVGGTVRPEPHQLELLRRTIAHFGSPWASEHLSWNATDEFRTGFFLPPRQTPAGVETAAKSIRDLQATLPVPIAVETGVNYLQPRPDEMPDGAFVAAVVEKAGCGLLLDLHNIFANAVNGRQSIDDFVNQLPLDRVWEIHLAGGFEMEGFWLDAHSGAIPDPLFEIAKSVVPALPNLKAIIFEMYPSFVPVAGYDTIRAELERLHELWELRGTSPGSRPAAQPPHEGERIDSGIGGAVSPAVWEQALGALAIGRQPRDGLARELAADPGVDIINQLIAEFRASMIVSVLRLTSRYMMLTLGQDVFRAILEDFWTKTSPKQFASTEAKAFADYLEVLDLKVPQLDKVLAFDRAVLATLVDEQTRIVAFDVDPLPLFRALADGRLPQEPLQPGQFEIEITPDSPVGALGADPESARQVFPFH